MTFSAGRRSAGSGYARRMRDGEPRRTPVAYVIGPIVCIAANLFVAVLLSLSCGLGHPNETMCGAVQAAAWVGLVAAVLVPIWISGRTPDTRVFVGVCAALVVWAGVVFGAGWIVG